MSLSPIKIEILETMLLCSKPQKAMEIAKQTKREFNPVMMHLLGLVRMGNVSSPEKGLYNLTEKGKSVLGISKITKEKAQTILSYMPHDKAFNFYESIDKPLNIHAHSLRDFANKIIKVDAAAIQFHMQRGDFEAWFRGVGDDETTKKINLLKHRNIAGEDLRNQLHDIVEQRYLDLAELSGQPIPPEDKHTHSHS
jgi:Family of unknown function (DUF5752)